MVIVHSDVVDAADLAPWTERKLNILLVPLDFVRWTTENYWFALVADRTPNTHREGVSE
jgi:hypothetical protein